jgi:hypothetical protein
MTVKINIGDERENGKCPWTNKIQRLRKKKTLKDTSLITRTTDPMQFALKFKGQRLQARAETETKMINATDRSRNENGIDRIRDDNTAENQNSNESSFKRDRIARQKN